jgi:hypothetical protein
MAIEAAASQGATSQSVAVLATWAVDRSVARGTRAAALGALLRLGNSPDVIEVIVRIVDDSDDRMLLAAVGARLISSPSETADLRLRLESQSTRWDSSKRSVVLGVR